MGRQPDHFYEFGAFRVDVTERLLLRDGEPVPLPPKVFDTLLVLVENNGHLVERDVLMKSVWPDTFVEDANLTVNVSALRKLLGEGSADGCYIETVPRRGYRFSGRVKEVREEDGHPCAASNLIEQEAGGGRDGIDRTFQRKATDTGSHADTLTESRDGAGFSPNTPPPKVTSSRANNLPIQPTPFIGREAEAAAVDKLLRQPEVRLLTLTGPGGAGKTRLGLQVAAAMIDEFENGICFVSLAVIRDPGLVVSAIAKALGISESGDRPLTDSLKDSLREKQILLLLDNFEQVISAALLVSELLGSCPRLKVLVTSRAVLHLRGEHEFAVPPLELPDPKRPSSVEALLQYASVALFIQRALEVKPDFVMSDETSNAVAEICMRLDGLPLAIYSLGNVAQRQGDYKQAGKLFEESLIQFRELGDKWGVADSLEQLAEVACSRGQLQRAAQLFGAAEAMREAIDASLPLTDRGNYDNTVAATRGGLPPEAFAAAWARGRRMTFEQAIAYVLERNA